jgi:hypothetical protein
MRIASERDYLIGYAVAKLWLEQEGVPLPSEQIESLARTIIDAVDDARAKRQQEY